MKLLDDYLDLLADNIGSVYFDMNTKLLERNHNEYHITVFNVQEYSNMINKCVLDDLVESKHDYTDIVFNGVGSISKGDLITYYILVESKQLDKLREDYGFDKKHFHITVAFNKKDLFHLPKDKSTKIID